MFCTKCGRESADIDVYCAQCGNKLIISSRKEKAEDTKTWVYSSNDFSEEKRTSRGLIAVVAIILLVFFALLTKGNSGEDSHTGIDYVPAKTELVPSLNTASKPSEYLDSLNNLGFGRWEIVDVENGSSGKKFVSNWPCSVFMADTEQDALNYWNWMVNVRFYQGEWLATKDSNWVVNDASTGGECIRFFANEYGGMIRSQK